MNFSNYLTLWLVQKTEYFGNKMLKKFKPNLDQSYVDFVVKNFNCVKNESFSYSQNFKISNASNNI